MSVTIQERRDTAANFASVNPVLAAGENAYETDTGKEKRGDGTTTWNSLAYKPSIGVNLTGTPTAGQVPVATSGTAATWQTPSGGGGAVTSVAGRTGAVVLTTADVTGQASDSAKINGIAVTGTPTTGQVPTATSGTAATWQTPATGGVSSARQIISGSGLTGGGDLTADRTLAVIYGTGGGQAAQGNDSRIINALPNSATFTALPPLAVSGGFSSADLQVTIATATSATTGTIKMGTDLAGTGLLPTVARINGTSVPATPTAGQYLVATSGTAATWQAGPQDAPAPIDFGYKAWTYEPLSATTAATFILGQLYLSRLDLRGPQSLTKFAIYCGALGTSLTAGQNFIGLYNSAGTLVASTADLSSALTAASENTLSFASGYSAPAGQYWTAILFNGTGSPSFQKNNLAGPGQGQAGVAIRNGTYGSALTALPGTITLGSITKTTTNFFWTAVL